MEQSRIGWKATLLICTVILLAGAGALAVIFSTQPEATRREAAKETAMLVDVTEVRRGDYRPVIRALAKVEPEHDVSFKPRVDGEIISRSDDFTPGGFVSRGDVLVEIDPADYENTLARRKSELDRAVSDLRIEMGRQQIARQDYEATDGSLSDRQKALVLRRPQLRAARAAVKDSEAAVNQAELELERTRVRAPFDAHVLSRDADLGSQVSAGESLGRLVGTDTFWVEATVPLSSLRWLEFPEKGGKKGSEVRISHRSAWPEGVFRKGRLYKLVGALEEKTRLARVLVEVKDPFALEKNNADIPAMLIKSIVEARITGRPISGVIRLERGSIRKNDTVWVMKDGKLEIRDVEIVFSDAGHAYIRKGLEHGEKVVTSSLATVAQGARLRLKDHEEGGEAGSEAGTENSEQGG
ncbi:MAG: efflux RND transporter periplasmic adaptor subunit [Desulfosalsimonas sp.]